MQVYAPEVASLSANAFASAAEPSGKECVAVSQQQPEADTLSYEAQSADDSASTAMAETSAPQPAAEQLMSPLRVTSPASTSQPGPFRLPPPPPSVPLSHSAAFHRKLPAGMPESAAPVAARGPSHGTKEDTRPQQAWLSAAADDKEPTAVPAPPVIMQQLANALPMAASPADMPGPLWQNALICCLLWTGEP